jgi:hypothetical protein
MPDLLDMQIHALDTCALTDLAEPDHAALRQRVVAHARTGRLIVPVTQGLLWEVPATRARNDGKYRAMVDLLWRISRGGHVLMNVPGRCAEEARARRALTREEIFLARQRFVPVVDPTTVDSQAAEGAEMARALLREEEERVRLSIAGMDESVRAHYGNDSPHGQETSVWRSALRDARLLRSRVAPFAQQLARAALEKTGARERIDVADLDPRSLPTCWSHALIHVARVRDVVVLGQRPSSRKATGQLDVVHLQEAAGYADVFVTSDRRLRLFAGRVHGLTCRVLSFADWGHHIEDLAQMGLDRV